MPKPDSWAQLKRLVLQEQRDNQPVAPVLLYDVSQDPKETADLAAQHPVRVAVMKEQRALRVNRPQVRQSNQAGKEELKQKMKNFSISETEIE